MNDVFGVNILVGDEVGYIFGRLIARGIVMELTAAMVRISVSPGYSVLRYPERITVNIMNRINKEDTEQMKWIKGETK